MQTLRQDAQAIIDKALADALPDSAVRRALEQFQKPEGRLVLIAAGKAAWQMAKAAYDVLGTAITGGAVITKYDHVKGPIGALELFDCIYDIDTVSMTIYQPRRSNVSTFTIPKQELCEWADKVLTPTAELAFQGSGEYHCGEWCQFCKAKADCRERAKANMELARYEFRQPPLLTDEEVEEILGQIDGLTTWASDIKDYALQAAISGKQWSGYKLVEGRSNRKYTDEHAVIAAVTAAGYDPYEHKVLGITAMTAMLGKKQFNAILGDLITKPQGKPTLVPESDKRPAMTTIIDDFKEDN